MVSIDSRSFSSKLLEQKTPERLAYFQSIPVPHQKLRIALANLLLNIEAPVNLSVFFVVGSSGVGKTTLRRWTEKLLLESALPTIYTPLFWLLVDNDVWLWHPHQKLVAKCPNCQLRFLALIEQSCPRYCSNCHQWLGHAQPEIICFPV